MKSKWLIIGIISVLTCFFVSGTAYAGLSDGLVAYYPFNGNANDETGLGHNGTVNGASLTTDQFGNPNSAYVFDGTNDYIDVADAPDLNPTNAITITAWFKANSFDYGTYSWPTIVGKLGPGDQHGFIMSIQQVFENHPVMGFAVHMEGQPTNVGIPNGVGMLAENTWYFAAGVYDGSAITLYVGPALVSESVNYSGDIIPSSNNLNIGRDVSYSSSPERFFNGSIDDVRIYNRALSENEIIEIYGIPNPIPAPGAIVLGGIGVGFVSWLRRRRMI